MRENTNWKTGLQAALLQARREEHLKHRWPLLQEHLFVPKHVSIIFCEWPTSCIRGNLLWSFVGCWPDILQSVRSHAPKQCRFLLCRQRMAESRRQLIYQVQGTWPSNKEPGGGSPVIWENSGVHACGGICDLVYRDRYIPKKHCSCDIVPEDASSVASRHSRVLFLRSASNGNAWQELKWRSSWISELRFQDLKAVTFHFWALQEDHKVTLSLAFFQVPPFLAVLTWSELLWCVQGPDMSIPTYSSEKSTRSGTKFLEGRKLSFLASKQHQIALMKHQAAFESEILGSRPCCGWQDVTPEWVPVMPN